ncbi:AAA family ATPase [Glaciecola sp. 1036]|uniref:AAA family ATPase n=1 Tax=Alteromonadaceae TaxID=72275 RepID=UPI003D02FBEC
MLYPWLISKFNELEKRIHSHKLHHAILLHGESGVGIDELAFELAHALLCINDGPRPCGSCKGCNLIAAESHPDFHLIVSDKTQIGVDLVRSAIEKINNTAQLSGNKVVLVPNIDLMTEAAANAFLKTLEEPTNNTFLIMTSQAAHLLLPTIKSRCEKHVIAMPDYAQSVNYISSQSEAAPSELELKAYGNSPLKYLNAKVNKEPSFQGFMEDLNAIKDNALSTDELAKKYKEYPSQVVDWLFALLLEKQIESIKQPQTSQNARSIAQWIETELNVAKQKLKQTGTNKQLLISYLMGSFKSNLSFVL